MGAAEGKSGTSSSSSSTMAAPPVAGGGGSFALALRGGSFALARGLLAAAALGGFRGALPGLLGAVGADGGSPAAFAAEFRILLRGKGGGGDPDRRPAEGAFSSENCPCVS